MADIPITKAESSKLHSVDWDNLGFGKIFSDHMFVADYKDGRWQDYRIVPYGPMDIYPGNCTLHYGQTIFEGLKVFRTAQGHFNLFRPDMNAKRMNRSADRLCIPEFPENDFVDAICQLVKVDHEWIPRERGQTLYVRPFAFGTDDFLGVQSSESFRFIIMTSPVASYYAEGLNPVKIKVSTEYTRAVKGGLGSAKTAANYAASLKAGREAKKEGFAQVLWLDGVSHEFIDEIGAMNIMFLLDGDLYTPPLDDGTILAGVTRDTVIRLATEAGIKVHEERMTIHDIVGAHASGHLHEIFGTGTAAVISPVGELYYKERQMVINNNKIGPVAQKLYNAITGIQYGELNDPFGWNVKISAGKLASV
jgi:branched-chain amino acid aminotransferase